MATITSRGTTKRKPLLNYKGYSYVQDREREDKIYWCCSRYSTQHCHSRLHTCVFTNDIKKEPTEHSCRFDAITVELRRFEQQLTDRAKNTQETPEIIVTNCLRGKEIIFELTNNNCFFFTRYV